MDKYDIYSKDLEIENKKLQLQKEEIIVVGAMVMAVATGVGMGFGLYSCVKPSSSITWDEIKESSIVITKDDNFTNYHIVNNNENNKYYDLINDYNINPDTIIYTVDTASYLVNIDEVKNNYSKEELKEILNQFSMNNKYSPSDETVKVLVKKKNSLSN